MARDPMQGVINWFAILMACVLLASAGGIALLAWGLWRFVRHFAGAWAMAAARFVFSLALIAACCALLIAAR